MIRLRGGKVGRTDAHTERGRELSRKQLDKELSCQTLLEVTRCSGRVRLGPERKAIVLAAAGQSYVEKNLAQALRPSCPHSLASTKEFVHLIDEPDDWQEGDKTLAMSTSRDEEDIDALVVKFKAVNSEVSLDGDEVIRSQSHGRSQQRTSLRHVWTDISVPTRRRRQFQPWEQLRKMTQCFRCNPVRHFDKIDT